MRAFPKFAVVGSGAVGAYYGCKLASGGCDVHFLLRSDLEVVRREGFVLREEGAEVKRLVVQPYRTTGDISPVDIVLIAVKATSNRDLLDLLPPLLKQDTLLLTLQNGLGNEEFLAHNFGGDRVLGGICFVCLNRTAPGVIEHYGHGAISLGEHGRPASTRLNDLVATLRRCGVDAKAVENLAAERWRKLVWNIPFNGLSIAAGEITVADILRDPQLQQLARDLMLETIGIARVLGHPISANFVDDQISRSETMGAYKPSSLLDYISARPVEVEPIWGEPYRHALSCRVNAPRLATLYSILRSLVRIRLGHDND